VGEPWWTDGVDGETEAQLIARLEETMLQIQYADASAIIIVTHSAFFKAILSRHTRR
jgi:broad specificity phosphatase PhoE